MNRKRAPQTGFNGQLHEPATAWQLLGNGYRAYNPALMRFHHPDDLSPFERGGINTYAYCSGDPINLADPTGHIAWALLFQRMVSSTRTSFSRLGALVARPFRSARHTFSRRFGARSKGHPGTASSHMSERGSSGSFQGASSHHSSSSSFELGRYGSARSRRTRSRDGSDRESVGSGSRRSSVGSARSVEEPLPRQLIANDAYELPPIQGAQLAAPDRTYGSFVSGAGSRRGSARSQVSQMSGDNGMSQSFGRSGSGSLRGNGIDHLMMLARDQALPGGKSRADYVARWINQVRGA
jgi:RHS repeat-associated protein